MADAEMSATLAPCVAALARASVRAYRAAELKCLCATLSALWNLASHSRDNKKAICEEPGFLEMLIELLTNDAQQTVSFSVLKFWKKSFSRTHAQECVFDLQFKRDGGFGL